MFLSKIDSQNNTKIQMVDLYKTLNTVLTLTQIVKRLQRGAYETHCYGRWFSIELHVF